ncbi:2-hydroxyacid dehydrogenase [Brucepastera parasyntrophica]|nr:2-hydroxyacid dehydrogenase [Brucepastera parasyntrophica]
MRIAFYDTKPFDRVYFEQSANSPDFSSVKFEFDFIEGKLTPLSAKLAKDHEVVCVFVNDHVTKEIVDILYSSGVRMIALRSAGYNNVDLEAVWEKIHVVRVPAYSPHAVAEYAVALLQTLNRKIHSAYNRIRDGNFQLNGLVGRDLYGKTAGIIGTGKIGKICAEILNGYGMHILLNDLYPDQAFADRIGAKYVEREELYRSSDVISLHCPLTPENYHMINRDNIALMKSDVIIINTGRGGLVDSQAMIEALKEGRIRGAGLDVYEEEDQYFFEDWSLAPIQDDNLVRLIQFPNVLLTSHQAFLTSEALEEIARTTLENIRLWVVDKKLANEICYQCDERGNRDDCRRETDGSCWPEK